MHLVPPHGQHKKWSIRFRNHDGRTVSVQGDRDESVAERMGVRIDMLIRAKAHGDAPPMELVAWIDGMPEALSKRLIELGLLDTRRFQRTKPLEEHIVEYGRIVASRKSNGPRYSKQQENKIRRGCAEMKITRISDLNGVNLMEHLKSQTIATSTRRAYIIAFKDFAGEMVNIGALREDPFLNIKAPGAYEAPEYERQPMTVTQFQTLMRHLDTFDRYKHQNARWTAHDRKMIYWTAVKTGYRQTEMKKLVKANFHLDQTPAVVSLKARHTKNKTEGDVPIPTDLAAALRVYLANLEPNDKVFVFPTTSGSIVDMLRKDLAGCGIVWKLPTGEVIDFHSLRSTAITWWLDEDKLSPKRVQVLARLKTLALVYNYSRNLRIEDWSWLETSPKLVS